MQLERRERHRVKKGDKIRKKRGRGRETETDIDRETRGKEIQREIQLHR